CRVDLRGYAGWPRLYAEVGSCARVLLELVELHGVCEGGVANARRVIRPVECIEQSVATTNHQLLVVGQRVGETRTRPEVALGSIQDPVVRALRGNDLPFLRNIVADSRRRFRWRCKQVIAESEIQGQ